MGNLKSALKVIKLKKCNRCKQIFETTKTRTKICNTCRFTERR